MSKEQTLLDHALTNSNENEAINSLRKLRKMKVEATAGDSSQHSGFGDYTPEQVFKVITQLENKAKFWQTRSGQFEGLAKDARARYEKSKIILSRERVKNATLTLEINKMKTKEQKRKYSGIQDMITALSLGGIAMIIFLGLLML